jgi:hypothetical protein
VFLVYKRFQVSAGFLSTSESFLSSASDLLTGIYLYIIGIEDLLLKKEYNRYSLVWRSSPLCSFAGGLAVLSVEVTTNHGNGFERSSH